MTPLSPIARKQRALYGMDHGLMILPGDVMRRVHLRAGSRLGYFGLTSSQSGAAKGASTGASVGSIIPIIGTGVGAILGAIGGAIAGSLGKVDPENRNFTQASQMAQANPTSVLSIANKYLVLAGLFDLQPKQIKGNIPIYKRYGRMGEQKFVTDMAMLIYNAAQSGQITASDTPQSIMVRIVQPWIDSWGFGPMVDNNAQMINMIIMGMIAEYVAGLQTRWLSIGGSYPFGNLPKFSLPAPAPAPTPTPTPQPVQVISPSGPAAPTVVTTPAPTNILSANGSTATPGSNTGLKAASGAVFYFGPTPTASGDFPVYTNGQPDGSAAIGLALLNGGRLYQKRMSGNWFTWMGTQGWAATADPTLQVQTPTPAPSSTVAIPSGFSVVATDAATGLPIYGTVNGGYFAWNGTTMTPFSGALTNGSIVTGGGVTGNMLPASPGMTSNLPSLTSGSQQLYNSSLPPLSAPVDTTALSPPPVGSVSAPPASVQPTTAGVSGAALPSWMTWGAIAAVAALMFATARPVGRLPKPRQS